ncbi:MAG: hypothetical protein AAB215_06700 [Planctomycetota bacterium]
MMIATRPCRRERSRASGRARPPSSRLKRLEGRIHRLETCVEDLLDREECFKALLDVREKGSIRWETIKAELGL